MPAFSAGVWSFRAEPYMFSITEEMEKKLEQERKRRLLDTIPETVGMILSEYLSKG